MPRRGPPWGPNGNTLLRLSSALIRVLPYALSAGELEKETGMHQQTVDRGLQKLVRLGKVEGSGLKPVLYRYVGKNHEL